MKIRSTSFIYLIFLLPAITQAQDLNSKVLLTIGSSKTEAGEFIRMYRKSAEPGKTPDIEGYLQQFILFKMKVADAVSQGYDTTKAFKTELSGYRNQLAQSYLTDTQTKEKLIRQAYQRSLTEINAWHILVGLPPEPSPEDTLKAWQKASDIKERIVKGESFETVARGTSDDQSVKVNGGNLGYFTVFQMIMPFEDAAYSLRKGGISDPVRTPYGYHIIKVTDKRPSKGKVRVAHIMKAAPPGTGETELKKAETDINDIYVKLRGGTPFSELAKEFSDHKESASKGGELNWFGAGEIISDFSEAAFAIKDTGTYTKPVHTIYGWHIIKLLEKKTPGTFEETRSYLESKINQSYLNSISKKSFIEKLKREYKFKINQESFDWFVQNTDTLIIQGLKKYDRSTMPEGNMYTFANQRITNNNFANLIEKRSTMIVTRDSSVFISKAIETSASDQLLKYEDSVLEKKYPEFRYLMNEFHDGILLFEISGRKVWNRISNDSTGLRKFYEEHKNNYLTKQGIEAKIYTLKKPDGEKALFSAYKKYAGKSLSDDLLRKKFNKKGDTLLVIEEGKWTKGTDNEIDKLKWSTGSESFIRGGYPAIINIRKVIDPVPLGLDDVMGEMMTLYQEYLESEWTAQLKEKYTVKTDSLVLEEVKKKLNNE
ncbi:MAG: peptidylprolyl isomerase [Bacteroidales bacterium]|nr:peptidylprolyl isomerase [Bacteroidales bacterium]